MANAPKTIEELKAYCQREGMPLEKMRFFVGVNYQLPRAFGIFRDGDRFVVYKNKDDGSRAIRYQGPDEAYAVNELYLKLLDECHIRNIYPAPWDDGSIDRRDPYDKYSDPDAAGRNAPSRPPKERFVDSKSLIVILKIIVIIIAIIIAVSNESRRSNGSYNAPRYGGSGYWDSNNDSWSDSSSDYDSWDSSDTDWSSDW